VSAPEELTFTGNEVESIFFTLIFAVLPDAPGMLMFTVPPVASTMRIVSPEVEETVADIAVIPCGV
jgi:hypothetical protein